MPSAAGTDGKHKPFVDAPKVSLFVAAPDPSTFVPESRVFSLEPASSTACLALNLDGSHSRSTVWDTKTNLSKSHGLFKLKVADVPQLRASDGRRKLSDGTQGDLERRASDASGQRSRRSSKLSASASVPATSTGGFFPPASPAPGGEERLGVPKNVTSSSLRAPSQKELEEARAARGPTKAQKYYDALLKAERKRNEAYAKAEYDETISKAEAAAMKAYKAMVAASVDGSKTSRSDSRNSSDEESEEESDDEPMPLQPYDGSMQIVVEIMVQRAPGEQSVADDKSSTMSADTGPTTASSTSTPRLDLADELLALQEELGPEEEEEDAESEGLPDGLSLGNMDNIYSINDPRLALGIAGTVYFVPEVERYSLGPSLPPPPPPSLLGRRRLRLKPRLPLEISNHRYEDEHPNMFTRKGLTGPTPEEKRHFEETMCTHDFYAAATKSMTRLPKLKSASEYKVMKKQFGQMIDKEIRKSYAWKTKLHREFLGREDEKRKAAERAAEEAREEEARKREEARLKEEGLDVEDTRAD